MSNLSAAERNRLPEEEFGDPERRLFPICDQEDLDSAARLIGKAHDPEDVKQRIIAIARRKGLQLPQAWRESHQDDAVMNGSDLYPARSQFDGRAVVYPNSKLFEAGDWPDKQFAMTPEELWAAAEQFDAPVPLDLEHTPTVLDGKLGEVRDIRVGRDGRELFGTVAIPKWLDDLLEPGRRKVSCEWDRHKKTLRRLSLVSRPRISDAALMAAFSRVKEQNNMMKFRDVVMRWLGLGAPDDFDPAAFTSSSAGAGDTLHLNDHPRFRAMRLQIEDLQAERIQNEAAAFADSMTDSRRILPAERAALIALYARAASDDEAYPTPVTFGEDRQGSRLEALRAAYSSRMPHPLLTEMHVTAAAQDKNALFNKMETPRQGADRPPTEERKRDLLSRTPLGLTVLDAQTKK